MFIHASVINRIVETILLVQEWNAKTQMTNINEHVLPLFVHPWKGNMKDDVSRDKNWKEIFSRVCQGNDQRVLSSMRRRSCSTVCLKDKSLVSRSWID